MRGKRGRGRQTSRRGRGRSPGNKDVSWGDFQNLTCSKSELLENAHNVIVKSWLSSARHGLLCIHLMALLQRDDVKASWARKENSVYGLLLDMHYVLDALVQLAMSSCLHTVIRMATTRACCLRVNSKLA